MLVDLVGTRLRACRVQAGRTLASVAIDAGVSVPYVANLERGRGNPTLGVLESLADVLGTTVASLVDDEVVAAEQPLPPALTAFVQSERFRRDTRDLAEHTGIERRDMRRRIVRTLATIAAESPASLDELGCHRAFDALYLIYRRGRSKAT